MNRRSGMGWKRITSGSLAFTIVNILILGNSGIVFVEEYGDRFYREEADLSELGESSKATVSNASFKDSKKDDVVVSIFSKERDFRSGGLISLNVHLKNETGIVIIDGTLTCNVKGVQADSAGFFLLEKSGEGAFDTGISDDNTTDDSILGTGTPENEDGTKGPGRIDGIEPVPGQVYSVRFTSSTGEDIEGVWNQQVKFRFNGRGKKKRIRTRKNLLCTVNYLNVGSVEFRDGNRTGIGEMVTMGIRTSVFNFDVILEDSLKDETDIAPATPSEAVPIIPLTMPSEALPAMSSQVRPGIPTEPVQEITEKDLGIPWGIEAQTSSDLGEDQTEETTKVLSIVSGETETQAPTGTEGTIPLPSAEEAAVEQGETETQESTESSPTDSGKNQTQASMGVGSTDPEEATAQASDESGLTEAADTGTADTEAADTKMADIGAASTMSSEHIQGDSIETGVIEQGQSEKMRSESVATAELKSGNPSNEYKDTAAGDVGEARKNADEGESEDYTVDLEKVSCRIEIYNAKLNGFKMRKAMVNDVRENMLICSCHVSGNVSPGIYFRKITQEDKTGRKTCKSAQGFLLVVAGDGEISLENRIGDAVVTVSGSVDSFPRADQIAVRVSEVGQEHMAQMDEALERKSQEEGVSIQSYKVLDIKPHADGIEVESVDPTNIAFKDLELEKHDPAAASNMLADVSSII